MAKAWSEVAASPDFQALQPDQQDAARKQYFDSVVAPKVPPSDLDVARQQFEATASSPPPDKYKQTAMDEIGKLRANGVPVDNGLARQYLQGATFGFADEALAGLTTPLEMIKRGTLNPAEAYKYAKAREDVLMEDARKKGGVLGTGMEVLGGAGTGTGLANAGATFTKEGAGALANIPRMAGDAAVYGGVTGFAEGNGTDRFSDAAKGAAIGGAAGGVLGAAAPAIGAVGRNALGWISATRNPEKFAQGQLARAVSESGQTPSALVQELTAAQAAGQPMTLADALGNSGQRMLSTVARAPGQGRTDVVNFLDARQAGQGRRIANALSEGFEAPNTAQATEAAMRETRSQNANAAYGAARNAGGAVDVSPAINIIDRTLQPGATSVMRPQTNIADDSIEAALRRAKGYLTDGRSVLTDFNGVLRSKQEIDAMIERAAPTVQRELIPVKNALDDALSMASQPYAAARDQFRTASKSIEALGTGKQAATRGRSEDTTRVFGSLGPDEQKAFRVGYVDPLIEQVQNSAVGANKARQFTSDAMQQELPTFSAPGKADDLTRRLQRENLMFETRATATGGSKTADNLADASSLGVSPEVIGNLLSGNFLSAGKNLVARSSDTLSGNTAPVRQKLAQALLKTGTSAAEIERLLESVVKDKQAREHMTRLIASALMGGATTGTRSISGR